MIEILHFDLSVVLFSIDIQWKSLVIKQSQLLIVFLLHIHVIEADISATELVRKLVFHQMICPALHSSNVQVCHLLLSQSNDPGLLC